MLRTITWCGWIWSSPERRGLGVHDADCSPAVIDLERFSDYPAVPMSNTLPEVVDAWRMVSARRIFQGVLPLASMSRLSGALSAVHGDCEYVLEFGRDALGVAFLDVQARAVLPLMCQRTLQPFDLPVALNQRLGLIRDEREEAGLQEGYEAVLLPDDGMLRLADVIEDELILSIPVVPLDPKAEPVDADGLVWNDRHAAGADDKTDAPTNPFAVLAGLKNCAD